MFPIVRLKLTFFVEYSHRINIFNNYSTSARWT